MALKNISALTCPLSELQLSKLQLAMTDLTPVQTAWVSGYLAGVSHAPDAIAEPAVSAGQNLTILFGSQTGNSKGVAEQLGQLASTKEITHTVVSMADYKAKNIKDESHLIVIVSTNGEGEAPDDAIDLHTFLASKKAPKLDKLKFAVLSMGDTSYEFYCQTGKDFDQRLSALGATAVIERLDTDVDYETVTPDWFEKVLARFKETLKEGSVVASSQPLVGSTEIDNKYDKHKPFTASLLINQKITGNRSAKEVRHIEIDLEGSDLHYSVGDALGVWFENDPQLVDALIKRLGLDPQAHITIDNKSVSLKQALAESFELTGTHPAFVEGYAKLTNSKELLTLAEDKNKLRDYANTHQVIDVVSKTGNEAVTAENFVTLLRRLSPRLYSIASSQTEVEEEVHLTVGTVKFENEQGEKRQGGASSFLAERLQEGSDVKVFIEKNNNFRLPADSQTPIIMVGPGTGIAPFRAFLQEREATDATGKNWLFFGEQTFNEDFLYQTEWQGFLKSGLLTNLDLAFSRDQAKKIYVQDRLKDNAHEIYQWLQEGAHFYVCGDANRMAKDVQETLIEIIGTQGNKSLEDAEQYLTELRQAKRYQRDVY